MEKTEIIPNKTVVISGAAGGLGTVLVKTFSDIGYHVIAIDIDNSGLTKFKDLKNVTTKNLDVTNLEQVKIFIRELNLDETGLDILVCLAGMYDTYPVTEADPIFMQKIIDVNLLGTASLIQGFLNPLINRNGRVIVVSSESYKIQAMFQPYMISKAALEAYCRVARQELALKGVKLTVIRPGAIRTPLLEWMSSPGNLRQYTVFNQEYRYGREKSIKMVGRITSPEKVAAKIIMASTVSKPKWIYRINNNPVLTLVSFLPTGIIDRLIIKMFRKKSK